MRVKEEEGKLREVNMIDVTKESEEECCWMKEIVDFLQDSVLSKDKIKAQRIRMKDARFTIVEGVLFRKSFSKPLLRCVSKSEANEVLSTIHSGVCGNHSGGRRLDHKAITARYFWSYMMQDANFFLRSAKNVRNMLL